MKKLLKSASFICLLFFLFTKAVYASSNTDSNYILDLANNLALIAVPIAVIFIGKGGYEIMTSSGNPMALSQGKRTVKNALIGLFLVLTAQVIVNLGWGLVQKSTNYATPDFFKVNNIEVPKPEGGIISMIIEAIFGFLRSIVESATKPFIDGLLAFLTSTPTLLGNPTIMKFWGVILGLTGSLFVLIMALLATSLMTGDILGFVGEVTPSEIIKRSAASIVGAFLSLTFCDTLVRLSNFLVSFMSQNADGIAHSWVMNVIQSNTTALSTAPLVTLVMMIAYLFFVVWLMIMYVVRLVLIVTGAVFGPIIFVMLAIPKFQGFAEGIIRNYIIIVFMPFVHITMILLFAAFISMPEQKNAFLSLVTAIGLFLTMIKVPGFLGMMAARGQDEAVAKKSLEKLGNIISSSIHTVGKIVLTKGGGGGEG